MNNKKDFYFTLFLFALAFGLRLLYTFSLEKKYFFAQHPASDVVYYQNWAKEIAYGDWVGEGALKGLPLYPYFLALVYRLALGNWFIVRLVHLVLGSINVLLLFNLTRKIFPRKVSYPTGILMATNLLLIFYDWLMMPVPLLIFIGLVILNSLQTLKPNSPPRQWFFLGIMVGLGILGDGKFLIFLFFLAIYFFLKKKEQSVTRNTNIFLPLIAGIILIVSCVSLRNRMAGGEWTFISSHSGINFYIGNNPKASGIFENPNFIRPDHYGIEEDQRIVAEKILNKKLTYTQASHFWQQQSFNFIRNHPWDYLKLLAKKIYSFVTEQEAAYEIDYLLQQEVRQRWDMNPLSLIFPLSLFGLILVIRRRENVQPINFLLASQLIFTLLFFLLDRHRASILPLFIIYETYALVWLAEQLQRRDYPKFIVGAGIVILGIILLKPQPLAPDMIKFLKLSKAGPIYDEQREFKKAQENYAQALQLRPADANTLYNLGTSLSLEDHYTDAIPIFHRALALNPYDINTQYNLAYSYEQTGQTQQAIVEYRKAIDLDALCLAAYFRLAEIYKSLGNCPEANQYYLQIPKKNPRYRAEAARYIRECTP